MKAVARAARRDAVAIGVAAMTALLAPRAGAELPPGVTRVEDVERQAARLRPDLDRVAESIEALATWAATGLAGGDARDVDARLAEARGFVAMGHHEQAAVLLFELVESEPFASHPAFGDALFLFGQALRASGNTGAAREAFERLEARGAVHRERAAPELIDIALDLSDAALLQRVVGRLSAAPPSGDRARFALGKGLFHLGRSQEADATLRAVSATSAEYGAARYYLGVIATSQQRPLEALERFREARDAARANASQDQPVFGAALESQSLLAIGRLLSDQGDIAGAAEAYEAVSRDSPAFERALLELAWAHLGVDALEPARDALEVLLVITEDRPTRTEAGILRGRVLDRLGRVDDAVDAYTEAMRTLDPIRAELRDVSESQTLVERYFDWLVERRATRTAMPSPLTDGAESFMGADHGLSEVVGLLDMVGHKRRDLDDMADTIAQLEAALAAPRPVDIFPELQAPWLRAMEAENSLIVLQRSLLDLEQALHTLDRGAAVEPEQRARRHGLERELLRNAPQTVADYRARAQALESRMEALRRGTFLLRQRWRANARQLHAMEAWLAQTREERDVEAVSEQRLVGELVVERMLLEQARGEIDELERSIEIEAARAGVASVEPEDTANIKNQIFDLQLAEHQALERQRGALSPAVRRVAEALARSRDDGGRYLGQLARVVRAIDTRVTERVRDLARVVQAERKQVGQYRTELDAVAESSRYLASSLGRELFRVASGRVDELALDADVGILDVAWSRKESRVEAVRAVQREQGQRLEEVRRALRELEAEAAALAGTPRSPERAPATPPDSDAPEGVDDERE